MPIRSCIVCRARMQQSALQRIRLEGDSINLGPAGSGRSAYLCDRPECRAGILAKGRLARALKRPIPAAVQEALRLGLNLPSR